MKTVQLNAFYTLFFDSSPRRVTSVGFLKTIKFTYGFLFDYPAVHALFS